MLIEAGTTRKRRNGLAWKFARGLRAGQSVNGVSREAGRASCLLDRTGIRRITPVEQDPGMRARFRCAFAKKEKAIEEIKAERNAKAARWAEAVLVSS